MIYKYIDYWVTVAGICKDGRTL